MTKQQKEVEAKQNNLIVPSTDLVDVEQMDMDCGYENIDAECFSVPILTILQALSPSCSKQIEGIKPGKIYNSLMDEVFDKILVVPCFFVRQWIEWYPRDTQKGFVQAHNERPIDIKKSSDGKGFVLSNGNTIEDTRIHYVLVINDLNDYYPAMIPMSKSQIKKSNLWNTLMSRRKHRSQDKDNRLIIRKLAPYTAAYSLSTAFEQKQSFNWFGWTIALDKMTISNEIYLAAKELYERCKLSGTQTQGSFQKTPLNEEDDCDDRTM